MLTPIVTEISRHLEPSGHDDFVSGLAPVPRPAPQAVPVARPARRTREAHRPARRRVTLALAR